MVKWFHHFKHNNKDFNLSSMTYSSADNISNDSSFWVTWSLCCSPLGDTHTDLALQGLHILRRLCSILSSEISRGMSSSSASPSHCWTCQCLRSRGSGRWRVWCWVESPCSPFHLSSVSSRSETRLQMFLRHAPASEWTQLSCLMVSRCQSSQTRWSSLPENNRMWGSWNTPQTYHTACRTLQERIGESLLLHTFDSSATRRETKVQSRDCSHEGCRASPVVECLVLCSRRLQTLSKREVPGVHVAGI